MATRSFTEDERLVKRREMEDFVELAVVRIVNEGIHHHIRRDHPVLYKQLQLKVWWKKKVAGSGRVREFLESEEGK